MNKKEMVFQWMKLDYILTEIEITIMIILMFYLGITKHYIALIVALVLTLPMWYFTFKRIFEAEEYLGLRKKMER